MKLETKLQLRLEFLSRVVRKECKHLASTDSRLFSIPFSIDQARLLEDDPDLADRVEIRRQSATIKIGTNGKPVRRVKTKLVGCRIRHRQRLVGFDGLLAW